MSQLLSYIIPLALSAIISAVLAVAAWQRRPATGARSFAFLMLTLAWWSAGYAIEISQASPSHHMLWAKIQYLAVYTMPVAWLVFSLEYTGRAHWLTRGRLALLLLGPVIINAIAWTNELHGWVWQNVSMSTDGVLVTRTFDRGPAYIYFSLFAYSLILAGSYLTLHSVIRSPRLYQGQIAFLLTGAVVPLVANVAYLLGWSPIPNANYNLTPMTFAFSGMLLGFALFRYRLLDIVPIARGVVVQSMPDAVIVLDTHARVVDLNPRAEAMIQQRAATVIGRTLEDILPEQKSLIDQYRDNPQVTTQIALGEGSAQRHFTLRISPVLNNRNQMTGRVIILTNVTDQVYAAQERERLIHELEAYAYTVAHDLKNPIGNISAYAEMVRDHLDTLPREKLIDFLNKIHNGSQKMASIVEELLLLAQIRAAEQIPSTLLAMDDIVREARARVASAEQKAGASITLPDTWPPACGYAPWIEEVWANYLSNALKYGGDSPRIELGGALLSPERARYWVRDHGPGVSPQQIDYLFAASQYPSGTSKGYGLGLSIVQRILARLDGVAGVENADGGGALFWFELPVQRIEETRSDSLNSTGSTR